MWYLVQRQRRLCCCRLPASWATAAAALKEVGAPGADGHSAKLPLELPPRGDAEEWLPDALRMAQVDWAPLVSDCLLSPIKPFADEIALASAD